MTATIPDTHPHRHLDALRPSDDDDLTVPRRRVAGGLGTLRALRGRDPRRVRDGSDQPGHGGDAASIHPGAVRCDRWLRRRPQAADGLPDRMSRRRGLRARPGRRGPDPVLRPVRAPRPAVLRQGLDRLRRPRSDHRREQADAARPGHDPTVRRPGADDPRDRRHARIDARPARGRGLPGGASPVHGDARRPRARADDPHDGVARDVRGSSPSLRREFFDVSGIGSRR